MPHKKHVCLVTSSYPANYSRFLDREGKSLFQAGYKVTIIGLGDKKCAFEVNGIKVITVPERQLLRKIKTLQDIARAANNERADIYHCIDPWCLGIGLRIKSSKPYVKIIYESSEWFPRHYLDRTDLPLLFRLIIWIIITYLEYQAARKADAIIETNSLRAIRFQHRNAQVSIVPNYAPLVSCLKTENFRYPWFIYTGLICRPRGFDRMLIALQKIKQRFPEVKLIVRGEFDPRDKRIQHWVNNYIREHQLQANIQFINRVNSYEQVFEILKEGLCGVILLQPKRGNDWTNQPSKLFEFMVAGLAIVASNFPGIAPVINTTKCGWLVEDSTNPEMIAQVLEKILLNPNEAIQRGREGRRAAENFYNWGIAEKVLLELYLGITTGRGPLL